MRPYDIIRKKRDGGTLSGDEILHFINGYVKEEIQDYHAAALLMAIFLRGMETGELATWTRAMIGTGETLEFSGAGPYLDKHSTGGVGDKISLPLAPLVAVLGVKVPMISGRALGHTGGTLDKLESIPGYRVNLSPAEFKNVVETVGCCISGQTGTLVPADKKLYALRDVTGTVESIPLIASSILSKKKASGISGLVMDVKTGSGAFMKSFEQSRALAATLVELGSALGMKVEAFVTDMDRPLGTHVGNSLEIEETIRILQGGGPADSRELTRIFAAAMLAMGGLYPSEDAALVEIDRALADGRALARFKAMIQAQGGDPRVVDDPSLLPTARQRVTLTSPASGWITSMNTELMGVAACTLGAGRTRVSDKVDPSVGFILNKRTGDRVEQGEPLLDILYNDEAKAEECRAMLARVYEINPEPTPGARLVQDRLSSGATN